MKNKIVVMEIKREGDDWPETSVFSIWTMYLFFNKNFPTKIVGIENEQEIPVVTIKRKNQIVWANAESEEVIVPDKIVVYREME